MKNALINCMVILILLVTLTGCAREDYESSTLYNPNQDESNVYGDVSYYIDASVPTFSDGLLASTNTLVSIEDDGYGDAAMEFIYQDDYYRYYLTSVRSESIMLTFENGQSLSLKDAILYKKISMEELIREGLDIVSVPIIELGESLNFQDFLSLLKANGFYFDEPENFYVRHSATSGNLHTGAKVVYVGEERLIVFGDGTNSDESLLAVQITWMPEHLWFTENYKLRVVYSGEDETIINFLNNTFEYDPVEY